MDINNKARIHWACRRGMRELDISIMPFFEHEYDSLSDDEKRIFIRLLECDDPDLFNWLMNHGKPADAELEMMVRLIQTRNRERGPVAICFARLLARTVAFLADSWAGCRCYFTHALAAQLHPVMDGVTFAGGV